MPFLTPSNTGGSFVQLQCCVYVCMCVPPTQDLDMMEIGNVPDFVCGSDGSALARCRLHYTMWCIMKSPLILGNNLPGLDAATIALLANKEAVAVNQDSWGVQARRVHVSTPANTSLGDQYDNIAVLAVCDPSRPTQAWRWRNESTGARNGLYIAPCDATDPFQEWTFTSGHLLNAGVSLCADASAGSDPGGLAHCSIIPSQLWNYSSGLVQSLTGPCLALYDNTGPDVTYSRCRAAGDGASDQLWSYSNFTGLLQSLGPSAPAYVTNAIVFWHCLLHILFPCSRSAGTRALSPPRARAVALCTLWMRRATRGAWCRGSARRAAW